MPRYLKSLLLILVFIQFFHVAFGQAEDAVKEKVDELLKTMPQHMRYPDSLNKYSTEAFNLSKDINYEFGTAAARKFRGIYAHTQSNFDEAIVEYKESLKLFSALGNELEKGKVNLNIATSYNGLLNYPATIEYGMEALKSFQAVKDPNGEGRVLNLLGIVSYMQKNYEEALSYFKQYNSLVAKAKDEGEISSSYNNLGSTFEQMGKIDSAIGYFNKSLSYEKKNGTKSNLGMSYQNIGALYLNSKRFQEGMKYHRLSMAAFQEDGNRKYLSHSYYNIGLSYKYLKDTATAIQWFQKASKLATAVKEKEILKEASAQLAGFDAAKQNFKSAYDNLALSVQMKDSILDVEKTRIVEDMKSKYEAEKKELQIKDLAQQSKIQSLEIHQTNIFLWISVAVIVLGSLLTYLYMNRRRIKEEARLQGERAEQQEMRMREVIVAEDKERRRIAAELHDGVGQTLSAALISADGLIEYGDIKNPEGQLRADRLVSLLGEVYDELRTISHKMVPNALIKSGLSTAIREFISRIDPGKLKISLSIEGLNDKMDESIETAIYRIIQEATNNVIRHSKASKLSIQLMSISSGITLAVEDNGIGFDPQNRTGNEGIGIRNIQNRVSALKGSIEFDSRPGKGTLINIYLPARS